MLELPWSVDFNALGYVLAGRGNAGAERRPIHTGQLAVFGPGDTVRIAADARQDSRHPNLEVLMLGGRPIGEPVVHYGPFVMNTKQEIAQAIADYQAGRLGQIPAQSIPHHQADDVDLPYLDAGPTTRKGGSNH